MRAAGFALLAEMVWSQLPGSRCFCCSHCFPFLFAVVGVHAETGQGCASAGVLLRHALLKVPFELAFPVPDQTIPGLSALACGCSVSATACDSGAWSLVLLCILIGRLPLWLQGPGVMRLVRVQAYASPPKWQNGG